jgi:Uma2 family endonuclease
MATQPQADTNVLISPEEYLALERRAQSKSEYWDGTVLAMSGASIPHNIIVVNLISKLVSPLRARGCQIYPSDLKVRRGRRFFYPDVSAVCGDPIFNDGEKDVVLNPNLIIEVLSPSTESYDKGPKFLTYQQIASLQEYLLVHQDRPLVEKYSRQSESSWLYTRSEGGDAKLEILACPISLDEIYEAVVFDPDLDPDDE